MFMQNPSALGRDAIKDLDLLIQGLLSKRAIDAANKLGKQMRVIVRRTASDQPSTGVHRWKVGGPRKLLQVEGGERPCPGVYPSL